MLVVEHEKIESNYIKNGDGTEKYVIKPNNISENLEDYIRLLDDIRGERHTYSDKEYTRTFLSNNDEIGLNILEKCKDDRAAVNSYELREQLFYYDYHDYYEEGHFNKYKYCYVFKDNNSSGNVSLLSKEVIYKFIEKFKERLDKNGVTIEIWCYNNRGFIKMYK